MSSFKEKQLGKPFAKVSPRPPLQPSGGSACELVVTSTTPSEPSRSFDGSDSDVSRSGDSIKPPAARSTSGEMPSALLHIPHPPAYLGVPPPSGGADPEHHLTPSSVDLHLSNRTSPRESSCVLGTANVVPVSSGSTSNNNFYSMAVPPVYSERRLSNGDALLSHPMAPNHLTNEEQHQQLVSQSVVLGGSTSKKAATSPMHELGSSTNSVDAQMPLRSASHVFESPKVITSGSIRVPPALLGAVLQSPTRTPAGEAAGTPTTTHGVNYRQSTPASPFHGSRTQTPARNAAGSVTPSRMVAKLGIVIPQLADVEHVDSAPTTPVAGAVASDNNPARVNDSPRDDDRRTSSVSGLLLSSTGRSALRGAMTVAQSTDVLMSSLSSASPLLPHGSQHSANTPVVTMSPYASVSGSMRRTVGHHNADALAALAVGCGSPEPSGGSPASTGVGLTFVRSVISDASLRHVEELCREHRIRETNEIVFRFDTASRTYDPILLEVDDEVLHYVGGPAIGGDDLVNIGNCNCTDEDIQQFFPGFDLRRFTHHDLLHHCQLCNRRPAAFVCLDCMQAFCPSHVHTHSIQLGNPVSQQLDPKSSVFARHFLFVNVLDIDHSYDRQLWCERCKRFTWKCLDCYEPLLEQIAYTRGTYLTEPVRDCHVVGYSVNLCVPTREQVDAMSPRGASLAAVPSWRQTQQVPSAIASITSHSTPLLLDVGRWMSTTVLAASAQGWRATQEDAESVFLIDIPNPGGLFDLPPELGSSSSGTDVHDRSSTTSSSAGLQMICLCVFDGHGGDAVSKLAASAFEDHLQAAVHRNVSLLSKEPGVRLQDELEAVVTAGTSFVRDNAVPKTKPPNRNSQSRLKAFLSDVLEDALLTLDAALRDSKEGRQGDFNSVGSTACVVCILPERGLLVSANVGDSGAALLFEDIDASSQPKSSRRQFSLEMITRTHRIDDAEEMSRIKDAGYTISGGRIEGLLAVPRALGDFDFKQCGGQPAHLQAVTAAPTIAHYDVTEISNLIGSSKKRLVGLVVGCDGLWDSFSSLAAIATAFGDPDNEVAIAAHLTEKDDVPPVSSAATTPPLRMSLQELYLQSASRCRPLSSGKNVDVPRKSAVDAIWLKSLLRLINTSIAPTLPPSEEEDVQEPVDASLEQPEGGSDNCSIILAVWS